MKFHLPENPALQSCSRETQLTSMNKKIKGASFKGILFRKEQSNFGNETENDLPPGFPKVLSER